jgi:serine 3-dehydrogenase
MKKLQNKITLITGATSGIGKACAIYFATEGSNLVIMSRSGDKLTALRESLENDFGVQVFATVCDVRKQESVVSAFEQIPEAFRNIDILINNAGLASGFDAIQDGSSADWEDMIDTNIKGLLYVTQQVIPVMQARKSGHIINLGSVAGHTVYPKGNVYCASKFAVKALTEGFRIDLLEYGIKVTSVDPGMVETNFSVIRFHGDEEKAKNVYKGFTPLTADDIADTILFAATRSANVNLDQIIMTPLAQANAIFVSRK